MKNKKTAKRQSPHLSKIHKQFSKRKAHIAALDERHEALLKRQKAMLKHHGGLDAKASDIIQLNVGGRDVAASRETLTAVAGSRLEELFCGKWENMLLRDEKGRVFLDVDPSAFEQVLEYSYHFKLGCGEEYFTRHENDRLFELYVDYFDLRSSKEHARLWIGDSGGCDTKDGKEDDDDDNGQDDDDDDDDDNECNDDDEDVDEEENESDQSAADMASLIQKEVENIQNYEKELDELEMRVNRDENFVSYFLQKNENVNDDKSYQKTAAVGVPEEDRDVVYLLVQGTTIGVKRSTLCLDKGSVLAKDFSDESWIKEHSVCFGGRCHFLMEYPSSSVVDMVNYLRCISMNIDKVKVDRLMPRYLDKPFWSMIRFFFPSEFSPFSILNKEQIELLDNWMIPRDIHQRSPQSLLYRAPLSLLYHATLRLLYRASSDGWDSNTYRKICDRAKNVPTLTVIKTVDGYILGGFVHIVPLRNVSGSFLFSLINPEGYKPTKITLKHQEIDFAQFRGLSSLCGPTFAGLNYSKSSVSNNTFCHKCNVCECFFSSARDEAATMATDDVPAPLDAGVQYCQWQSNVNLGDITSFDHNDVMMRLSREATVGVDLCVKVDGTGYASIEHAYKLPDGFSKDFMTGSTEFEITDFEVYSVDFYPSLF